MLKFWLVIQFIASISPVLALDLESVQILDVSTSEKSITIDRGEFDQYSAKDYAKFFIQIGEIDNPKIFLVAEGELVKTFPRKSYWYLKDIKIPNLISRQNKILILTSKQAGMGRSRRIEHKNIVFSNVDYTGVDQFLENNKKVIPDRLILEESNFSHSGDLYEEEKKNTADLSISHYEQLQTKTTPEIVKDYNEIVPEYYFLGNKKLQLVDIISDDDKKLLDHMSKQYLEKNSTLKYGLTNGLYHNQASSGEKESFNGKSSIRSYYDNNKEDNKSKEGVDPRLIAKIKRDGVNWSDDMDDEVLRKYFISTGIHQESSRRERLLNEKEGHEFLFYYTGSLNDSTTNLDQNYRALGYEVGISYDLHLSRANSELKSWSMQFLVNWGTANYDLGGINGRGQEVVYGGYFNYYLYNSPLTLNDFIFEIGVGLKAGQSHILGTGLSQEYTYQIMTMPSIQLLSKYRFRVGDLNEDSVKIGSAINMGIIYDAKKLKVTDLLSDSINGSFSVNDIKFLIGMGFYF